MIPQLACVGCGASPIAWRVPPICDDCAKACNLAVRDAIKTELASDAARLFLAAPELLRLLKLAADNIQGCIDGTDRPSTVIARNAHAAIAKAEGR